MGAMIESLWQLQQRCAASSATEVGRSIQREARQQACVAARELFGGEYDPEVDWINATKDLLEEQRRCRWEAYRLDELDAEVRAWERADGELMDRINYALSRAERDEAQPTEEDEMVRTVTAKRQAVKAAPAFDTFHEWRTELARLLKWPDDEYRRRNEELLDAYHAGRTVAAAAIHFAVAQVPETQAEAAAKEAEAERTSNVEGERTAGKSQQPTETDLPVTAIRLRSDNPRQSIDDPALRQLAEAIRADGLQNRIVVAIAADDSGCYEVWQGERRFRACRDILEWANVPVRIDPASTTDGLVRARAFENLAREDLNPIEQAVCYQQMLEAGSYPTQKALADVLQLSAGELSNRLRLLDLPKVWQQRVASGECPPGHARFVVPYVECPVVIEAIEQSLKNRRRFSPGAEDLFGSQDEFHRRVGRCVAECSRPLGGGEEWTGNGHVRCRLTKKQKADERLDVRTVKLDGKSEQRAFNVKLWDELNTARIKELDANRAKKAEQSGKGAKGPKDKQLTPAAKRELAKQREEAWRKKLYRYKLAWLVKRITNWIATAPQTPEKQQLLLKLLIKFACSERADERGRLIQRAVDGHGGTVKQRQQQWYGKHVDVLASLSTFPLDRMGSAAWSCVGDWIRQPFEGTRPMVRPAEIEQIAADMSIDFAAEWTVDQEFVELHSKEQLAALAKEWKLGTLMLGKRSEILTAVNTDARLAGVKAPKSLTSLKPVEL